MSFVVCGLDFGTLGARCVLVDALTGKEVSAAEHAYRHGVLEGAPGEAFQDPADYKEALSKVIREAVKCAALGNAVYAAVAGGAYQSIPEASLHMKSPVLYTAVPEREYGSQYRKYLKLSEVFRELGEEKAVPYRTAVTVQ